MAGYEYYNPSIKELNIKDPIDRIADIAHSCYQVDPKDHESNVKFVKMLCGVRHMAMLDHGYMHFRFDYKTFLKLITPSDGDLEVGWRHSKFFEVSADDNYAYLTLSMRSITDSIDAIGSVYLLKNNDSKDRVGNSLGQSYRFLIISLIKFLPEEIKDIVLTHFEDKDQINNFIDSNYDFINQKLFDSKLGVPYVILTDEDVDLLPLSIRESQQIKVYVLITDRGVTHELVRHRLCSFAQESTRYCNYSREKFGDKIKIIKPLDYEKHQELYDDYFAKASEAYFALLKDKALPQEARHVLPNGLRAQITITANLREWEHIFYQRLAKDSHPEARRVCQLVYDDMKEKGVL